MTTKQGKSNNDTTKWPTKSTPKKYAALLDASTPRPWQANRGLKGHLGDGGKDQQRFWMVQTNLITNGPEATLAEVGMDTLGKAGNPILHNPFGPESSPFKHTLHTITDAELAANTALMAHSVNTLEQAWIVLQQAECIIADHVNGVQRTAWQEVVNRMRNTLDRINTVKVWVE